MTLYCVGIDWDEDSTSDKQLIRWTVITVWHFQHGSLRSTLFKVVFIACVILLLETASDWITSTTQGFEENAVVMLMTPLFSGIHKNIQKRCRYYLTFIIYFWLQGTLEPSADHTRGMNTAQTFGMSNVLRQSKRVQNIDIYTFVKLPEPVESHVCNVWICACV